MTRPLRIPRRAFLGGALGAAGLTLWPRVALARPSVAAGEGQGRALVLLQLTGGNDGLSTVVPFGDDAYGRARKTLRLEKSDTLPLDDHLGLHGALRFLREELDEGRAALVQGVGYPNPNRSHFKSLDIWHSASPDGRAARSGWIGRLSEHLADEWVAPESVVHVGGTPPYSLYSKRRPPVGFTRPEGYRWARNEEPLADAAEALGERETGGALGHLRSVMREAADSSRRILEATADYRSAAEYPRGELGRSLQTVAALLKSDLGCRVVSLEHGGYDTHQGQRPAHDRLMAELDAALRAFRADLADTEAGRRTTILAFSEFGRRVVENASSGTDHGTAGPLFLLGDELRGGLHGEHPSLEERDGDDLVFTTDFRSVYATVLERLFDVDAERVLGGLYPRLPLFA